jgi:hypothetical protein
MERKVNCGQYLGKLQGALCSSSSPTQADAGGSATNSSYHAANADVGQTEDQMAEATIGILANLATST